MITAFSAPQASDGFAEWGLNTPSDDARLGSAVAACGLSVFAVRNLPQAYASFFGPLFRTEGGAHSFWGPHTPLEALAGF
jgi:hypothetical protein